MVVSTHMIPLRYRSSLHNSRRFGADWCAADDFEGAARFCALVRVTGALAAPLPRNERCASCVVRDA